MRTEGGRDMLTNLHFHDSLHPLRRVVSAPQGLARITVVQTHGTCQMRGFQIKSFQIAGSKQTSQLQDLTAISISLHAQHTECFAITISSHPEIGSPVYVIVGSFGSLGPHLASLETSARAH